jgi:hypothetical protein
MILLSHSIAPRVLDQLYDFVSVRASFAKREEGTGIEPVGAPLVFIRSQRVLQPCFITAPEAASGEDIA